MFLLYLHTKVKWHLSKNLCLFLELYSISFSFLQKMLYFVNNCIFPLLFQKNSVPLRYENDSKDI